MATDPMAAAQYQSTIHRLTDTYNAGIAQNDLTDTQQESDFQRQIDQLAQQKVVGVNHGMASLGARGLAGGVAPGYLKGAFRGGNMGEIGGAPSTNPYNTALNRIAQGYDWQTQGATFNKGQAHANWLNNRSQLATQWGHGAIDANAVRQAADSMYKSPNVGA